MFTRSSPGSGSGGSGGLSKPFVTRALAVMTVAAELVLLDRATLAHGPPRFRLDAFKVQRVGGVTQSRDFSARIADLHKFLGSLPDVYDPRPSECTYMCRRQAGPVLRWTRDHHPPHQRREHDSRIVSQVNTAGRQNRLLPNEWRRQEQK